MVKLVYTRALGARVERLAGSSPVTGTNSLKAVNERPLLSAQVSWAFYNPV